MTGSKWTRAAREQRRLTAEERALRAVPEAALQSQVVGLATVFGWEWCHWRALRNGRGIWQVPVEGPLGKGWPDLTLVRERDHRLVFAELKRENEDPTPEQVRVLEVLESVARVAAPWIEVYLWRPSDLADPIETSVIGRILR